MTPTRFASILMALALALAAGPIAARAAEPGSGPAPAVAGKGNAAGAADAASGNGHSETGSGPVLLLGYSPDQDGSGKARNVGLVSAGWRWNRDGADVLDRAFAKVGTRFSWSVEALAGGVFGDASAFEASVVPYAHFEPLAMEGVVPWFEGGIGLAYTSLRNYGLGSQVEFCDNAGLGIRFDAGGRQWSLGYRFRHLSHAGLFDDRNDGFNAHFLTLTVQ